MVVVQMSRGFDMSYLFFPSYDSNGDFVLGVIMAGAQPVLYRAPVLTVQHRYGNIPELPTHSKSNPSPSPPSPCLPICW